MQKDPPVRSAVADKHGATPAQIAIAWHWAARRIELAAEDVEALGRG